MPGCLSYIGAWDTTDTDITCITEAWDNKVSHEASLALPAVKDNRKGSASVVGFSNRFVQCLVL